MKILKIFLGLFLLSAHLFSQDVLTNKKGDEINCKVMEVGIDEVKYKRSDNLEGPTFVIAKSDIFMIKYSSGEKQIFNEAPSGPTVEETAVRDEAAEKEWMTLGRKDAEKYYDGWHKGYTATLIPCLILGPIFGLIPAGINASIGVREQHLVNNQHPEYFSNEFYKKKYISKANQIRRGKIWAAYGTGAAISAVAVLTAFFVISN